MEYTIVQAKPFIVYCPQTDEIEEIPNPYGLDVKMAILFDCLPLRSNANITYEFIGWL
jgi:hypothetical protein